MVFKQKTSRFYWYKFVWNGELIRESSKQTNKRVAETMEAAHRTALAKGEVGIRERKKAPTLAQFAETRFLPHIDQHFAEKPKTREFYRLQVSHLVAYKPLGNAAVDTIKPELVQGFITKRRAAGCETSTVNRALATLRRMLMLASEWGTINTAPPRIRLLPGENRRERVLSAKETDAYLAATRVVGDDLLAAYGAALNGIRATLRDEQPVKPSDPYLLHDVATLLIDAALRPDEVYRLRWDEVVDGTLHVASKTDAGRRVIPLSSRAQTIIEQRRTAALSPEWVFPAETSSGHIEKSTLKKPHKHACDIAKVQYFVVYTLRHTTLTRWAQEMDAYTLAHLAGHASFSTTRRYVHPQSETVREAMKRANARPSTKSSHTDQLKGNDGPED